MSPAEMIVPVVENENSLSSKFPDLRGVRWRINLGVLPRSLSSSVDDLRRVTADCRRRYAALRKRLLIDLQISKANDESLDLVVDDPLSQNPDSTWGQFFRNAELEKMVDNDLSRLYPEHGSYFHTPVCQGLLRRILLLWCLRHPEYGYRQGMHELLAPLLYVLHADIQHLNEVRKLYEDHFVDKFDEILFQETHDLNFKIYLNSSEDYDNYQNLPTKHTSLSDLDVDIQTIVLLSDPYGAEGELGIVLSERFLEHDAYCMFDALMSGAGGAVAMAKFFSHSSACPTPSGLAPVIEASLALYHLLSMVDSSLYSHLVELGVEPQYFALRWLRVLFGREFSLKNLLIIWDEIFSFDNNKKVKMGEHDPGVLNSARGAFISAMAVSMMLNVRSSLLATEYATSCLQRLLNYPEDIDLDKLMGKAKSLVGLAMEANVSSHPTPAISSANHRKQVNVNGHSHSLSLDSSPGTPVGLIPERYWEEKWSVVHKEEETKKANSSKPVSTPGKGWTAKIKSKLSRTESDPSATKSRSRERDRKSSTRRSLIEDLSRQLNFGEDEEEIGHEEASNPEDPLRVDSDIMLEREADVNKRCSGMSSASDEHSPPFSEPASPSQNGSEKSSTTSNISHDANECETQNTTSNNSPDMTDSETQNSFKSIIEDPPLPVSDAPDANAYGVSGVDDVVRVHSETVSNADETDDIPCESTSSTIPKVRKTLSGRFHWFWKFGRHNPGEGPSDKKLEVEDGKSADVGSLQEDEPRLSAEEITCSLNTKMDGCDQNLLLTLRNLGQSMLDNIQVVESAFQPEKGQAGAADHLSKQALVEKGQATAITALKELRKISSLLREI